MATKKAARKKAAKNHSLLKPCRILRINPTGTITPRLLKLRHNECVRLRSPKGLSADIKLIIKLKAGAGGPITIHS
jgi:hypothetical protein